MSIRAVLFDLDNTLTHRDQSIHRYAICLLEYYQEYLMNSNINQIIEVIRRIDNGGYPKKELLTYPSIGESIAHVLLQELEWHNAPSLKELTQFWAEQFAKNAVSMADAEELLKRLREQKYKLAIVSNGAHLSRVAILNSLGLSHYFDAIVSSGQVGISKPAPEIFLHTSQLLNVKPSECLFIGDHPINDIQGAKNVGMKTLYMDGFHVADIDIKNKITHLNQVLDFISSI